MPLTKKGSKILAAMKKEYGVKRGTQVFYASQNKGTIKGTHKSKKRFKGASMHGIEVRPRKRAVDCSALMKKCAGGGC